MKFYKILADMDYKNSYQKVITIQGETKAEILQRIAKVSLVMSMLHPTEVDLLICPYLRVTWDMSWEVIRKTRAVRKQKAQWLPPDYIGWCAGDLDIGLQRLKWAAGWSWQMDRLVMNNAVELTANDHNVLRRLLSWGAFNLGLFGDAMGEIQ
jgi:hypothetical protein